jgi:hypothetical protein
VNRLEERRIIMARKCSAKQLAALKRGREKLKAKRKAHKKKSA